MKKKILDYISCRVPIYEYGLNPLFILDYISCRVRTYKTTRMGEDILDYISCRVLYPFNGKYKRFYFRLHKL